MQQEGLPAAATREDDVILPCSDVVQNAPHVDVRDRVRATPLHTQILIDHKAEFCKLFRSTHVFLRVRVWRAAGVSVDYTRGAAARTWLLLENAAVLAHGFALPLQVNNLDIETERIGDLGQSGREWVTRLIDRGSRPRRVGRLRGRRSHIATRHPAGLGPYSERAGGSVGLTYIPRSRGQSSQSFGPRRTGVQELGLVTRTPASRLPTRNPD